MTGREKVTWIYAHVFFSRWFQKVDVDIDIGVDVHFDAVAPWALVFSVVSGSFSLESRVSILVTDAIRLSTNKAFAFRRGRMGNAYLPVHGNSLSGRLHVCISAADNEM